MENETSELQWDIAYSVGVDEFDEHHKRLIEIMNELDGVIRKKNINKSFENVLDELADYTIFHFNKEEEMMKEYRYPEYLKHKVEHEFFKKKLKEERNKGTYNIVDSLDMIKFLFDWLINHIMIEDRKYLKYFVKED